jgi:peptide/nickel transport system permease protein
MTDTQVTSPPVPGTLRLPRFVRSSGLSAAVGIAILVVIVTAALLAPVIAPYPPNKIDILNSLQAPSWSHLMGTDDVGRDVFSRVLYGVRLDIFVVLLVTYLPLPIGVLLGAIAGYFRGVTDGIISRVVDVVIAFPFLVLVIAVVAITGPGLRGAIIGILVGGWAMYARLARGEMLVLREQQFILAARALGYSHTRIVVKHALPNLLRSSIVFSAADIVINLLLLAGLSFLGLGVQPPTAELGAIVASGQSYLLSAWWIATLPGLVLVVIGVAVSMVGDAIGDRWGISNA